VAATPTPPRCPDAETLTRSRETEIRAIELLTADQA